jgi:hypothetical protein
VALPLKRGLPLTLHPAVVDNQVGHPGADIDQRLGALLEPGHRPERTQQRDRVEVDALGPEPGLLHRLQVPGEHLLLGGDQQHPQQPLAAGGLVLADHGVVELGLVDRDGQVVAGLEGERAAQLARLHPGQVDQADDHPLVGHPDDHPPAADPGPPPQVLDRGRHGGGVLDLTVDDRAAGQTGLPDPLEHDLAAADRHLGRANGGGADVESDDLSGHVAVSPAVLGSGARPGATGGGRESDRPAQVRP